MGNDLTEIWIFSLSLFGLTFCSEDGSSCYRNMSSYNVGSCRDPYKAIPGHINCFDGPLSSERYLPDSNDRTQIEMQHNKIRATVQPPAANMIQIKYNSGLESSASRRARQCNLTTIRWSSTFRPGAYIVGENILMSQIKLSWSDVLDTWESEKTYFQYGGPANGLPDSMNYSQVIWALTSTVGCAGSRCGDVYFYVCQYAQGMWGKNLTTPYVRSATSVSCEMCLSRCSAENSALCDCEGAICLGNSTLNLETCDCECSSNNFTSTDADEFCELSCDAATDSPTCGKGPFTGDTCLDNPETVFKCPWMCNICPYSDKGYIQGSVRMPWEMSLPVCTTTTTATSTTRTTTTLTPKLPSVFLLSTKQAHNSLSSLANSGVTPGLASHNETFTSSSPALETFPMKTSSQALVNDGIYSAQTVSRPVLLQPSSAPTGLTSTVDIKSMIAAITVSPTDKKLSSTSPQSRFTKEEVASTHMSSKDRTPTLTPSLSIVTLNSKTASEMSMIQTKILQSTRPIHTAPSKSAITDKTTLSLSMRTSSSREAGNAGVQSRSSDTNGWIIANQKVSNRPLQTISEVKDDQLEDGSGGTGLQPRDKDDHDSPGDDVGSFKGNPEVPKIRCKKFKRYKRSQGTNTTPSDVLLYIAGFIVTLST